MRGQVNQSARKSLVSLLFARILAITMPYASSIHSNQFQAVIKIIGLMPGGWGRRWRSVHGLMRW
jgi:hypothetical protein